MGTKSKKKNQSQRSQKKFQKTIASLFFGGVFLSTCHLALALNEFETRIAPDSYEIIWKENPCSQFQDDLKSLTFHKAKKITQNSSFFYENSSEPSLSLSPSQNQECQANIEPFFEEPTKLLLHHKILFKGPNCWNSTLYTQGFLKEHRFSSDQEFTNYLQSPFCQKITDQNQIHKNTVIAIRTYRFDENLNAYDLSRVKEVHGMIRWTPFFVLSKNTPKVESEFQLNSLRDTAALFRLDRQECLSIKPEKNCMIWTEFFNCQPPENLETIKRNYRIKWLGPQLEKQWVDFVIYWQTFTKKYFVLIQNQENQKIPQDFPELRSSVQEMQSLLNELLKKYENNITREVWLQSVLIEEIKSFQIQLKLLIKDYKE